MAQDDWITRKVKADQAREEKERELKRVLRSQMPELWESTIVLMLELAGKFNEEIHRKDLHIETVKSVDGGLFLERKLPPFRSVEAVYRDEAVEIRINRKLPGLLSEALSVSVRLDLSDQGSIVFIVGNERMTNKELAKSIIDHFCEGL